MQPVKVRFLGPTYSMERVKASIKVPTCPIPIRKRRTAKAQYISADEGNNAQMEPLRAKRREVNTRVGRRPIQSAKVPKMKLPTNIPPMYRLCAKEICHCESQTMEKSMVAVLVKRLVFAVHPWSQ